MQIKIDRTRSKDSRNARFHPQRDLALVAFPVSQDLLIIPAGSQLAVGDFLTRAQPHRAHKHAGLFRVIREREAVRVLVAGLAAGFQRAVSG